MAEQMPHLTPEIVDLAWEAVVGSNRAFDVSVKVENDMTKLRHVASWWLPGVSITSEAFRALEQQYSDAQTCLALLTAMASPVMLMPNSPFAVKVHESAFETSGRQETLSPEEQAYKEAVLERFGVPHKTYVSVIDVMNGTKAREATENKLPQATEGEARTALEAILTPTMIRAEMAQIAEFTANPENNSPEAAFDTVFVANQDLTTEDEIALADHIQGKIDVYKGDVSLSRWFHNAETAHRATGSNTAVTAVRAPRHLNVRQGSVAQQKAAIEAHNQNPSNATKLAMADDLVAMTHIALLIDTEAIDTTSFDDAGRFWATHYRNVFRAPAHERVPCVFVERGGGLKLGVSSVDHGDPARALVMPKA